MWQKGQHAVFPDRYRLVALSSASSRARLASLVSIIAAGGIVGFSRNQSPNSGISSITWLNWRHRNEGDRNRHLQSSGGCDCSSGKSWGESVEKNASGCNNRLRGARFCASNGCRIC
jgi:hypothetical protein